MSGPYIAIDFETSASRGACACAVGLVRVEDFEVKDAFYSLIRPPSSRIMFSHIHGLTWEDLHDAPTYGEVWPEMAAFVKGARYFVAHNAVFDRSVLRACCEANRIAIPDIPFLCTVIGSRRTLGLPSNRLRMVCEHLNIPLRHHHAGSDALACAMIHIRLRQLGLDDDAMKLNAARRKASSKPLKNAQEDG